MSVPTDFKEYIHTVEGTSFWTSHEDEKELSWPLHAGQKRWKLPWCQCLGGTKWLQWSFWDFVLLCTPLHSGVFLVFFFTSLHLSNSYILVFRKKDFTQNIWCTVVYLVTYNSVADMLISIFSYFESGQKIKYFDILLIITSVYLSKWRGMNQGILYLLEYFCIVSFS